MDKPSSPCLSQEAYEEAVSQHQLLLEGREEYRAKKESSYKCDKLLENHDDNRTCLLLVTNFLLVNGSFLAIVLFFSSLFESLNTWEPILIAFGFYFSFFVVASCEPTSFLLKILFRNSRARKRNWLVANKEKATQEFSAIETERTVARDKLFSIFISALETHRSSFLFRISAKTPDFHQRLEEYEELLREFRKFANLPYRHVYGDHWEMLSDTNEFCSEFRSHSKYLETRLAAPSSRSVRRGQKHSKSQDDHSEGASYAPSKDLGRGRTVNVQPRDLPGEATKIEESQPFSEKLESIGRARQADPQIIEPMQPIQNFEPKLHLNETSEAVQQSKTGQFFLFDPELSTDRKSDAELELLSKYNVRRVDWESLRARLGEIGFNGEVLVVAMEKDFLIEIGREDLARRVKHASKEQGDGLGYDVLSFFPDGREKYIEVKTTTISLKEPLYLSRRELELLTNHPQSSFIYRVLTNSEEVELAIFSGEQFCKEYELDPIRFLVEFRKS
jgi:hypothetical protein